MVAKRFFYVCAGLLCLALAYHLGAQSATAQAPGSLRVLGSNPHYGTFVESGGSLYLVDPAGCFGPKGWRDFTNAGVLPPGVSPSSIVSLTGVTSGGGCQSDGILITDTGAAYSTNNLSWQSLGTLSGGPTPAAQPTWGQIKSRYRQLAPGTGAATQDK